MLDRLPVNFIQRLQSVQNAVAQAQLILWDPRYDHITDALISLHWLRVPTLIKIISKIPVCPDLPSCKQQSTKLPVNFTRVADVPT